MPIVDKAEFARLKRSDILLVEQNERALRLQQELDEANAALSGLRRALAVDEEARSRIARIRDRLQASDSEAQISPIDEVIIGELVVEAEEQLRARIKAALLERHGAEIAMKLKAEQGPDILEELDELFETDGTYADIETSALAQIRREAAADLIEARRVRIRSEVDNPDKKAQYQAEIADEVAADPRVVDFAEAFEASKREEWYGEAIELAIAEAEHEILRNKAKIIAEIIQEYRQSWDGRNRLDRARNDARSSVEALALTDLLEKTGSQELADALEERARLETEKLEQANVAERLKLAFTNGGIDTQEIPKNTAVTILLGATTDKQVEYTTSNGYRSTKRAPVLIVHRQLTLTSLDEGRFRVDDDSLTRSDNPYARAGAIAEGSIISVGMLVLAHDAEKPNNRVLSQLLKAGATLQYDTDTSTPEFTDTLLPIGDVVIDGTSARGLEYIEMKTY